MRVNNDWRDFRLTKVTHLHLRMADCSGRQFLRHHPAAARQFPRPDKPGNSPARNPLRLAVAQVADDGSTAPPRHIDQPGLVQPAAALRHARSG